MRSVLRFVSGIALCAGLLALLWQPPSAAWGQSNEFKRRAQATPKKASDAERAHAHYIRGWDLFKSEQYKEAEDAFLHALELSERALGPKHHMTIDKIRALSTVYMVQGLHREAESLWKRLLAIAEEQHGREHLATAQAVEPLAHNYLWQGRDEEAAALFERALAIMNKHGADEGMFGSPGLMTP